MAKLAFLFPGQGSQRAGMGQWQLEELPHLRRNYFDRADEILGFELSRLCLEGPEEELVKTENQQPGIYLVSVATNAALRERGLAPAAVAGHSLGEYSALVAAGALDFEEGLRLTRRRGELMAEIGSLTGGIMAAVLGLPAADVDAACREASEGGVAEVANYNSPGQTVISGEEAPVRRAMELLRERGARRVNELPVSAPFHCSLMKPLATSFRPVLDTAEIREADRPIVANVTAAFERSPAEIRENLITQLASSVRWSESMQRLLAGGFDTFIEVGPGKVLTGLMRQIDPSASTFHTNDLAAFDQALTHRV